MSEHAVKIENLSKRYFIGEGNGGEDSLATILAGMFIAPVKKAFSLVRGKATGAAQLHKEMWALRDVSFSVAPGEVVGIIGHNGAGKSTLLKVLSRITEPTEGRIELNGRVASLLEVGTGFHPELTGRENIYMNGAILGMSRAEINDKFDEIVDFSEVGEFLDTPVKHYSSGMYVRLAFAVAAHLEPEILIVDEVLAVGDLAFQQKCLGKMQDVASGQGRTVLFVSHNMAAVKSLCSRAVLLDHGQVVVDGDADSVVTQYIQGAQGMLDEATGVCQWPTNDPTTACDELALRSIRLLDDRGYPQGSLDVERAFSIEIEYEVRQTLSGLRLLLQLMTPEGLVALATTDHDSHAPKLEPGRYRSTCHLPAQLLNTGLYSVAVGAGIPGVRQLLPIRPRLRFTTTGSPARGSYFPENWPGALCPALEWRVENAERVAT